MKNLIVKLIELKSLGAVGVKQSLEDEGSSFNEITLMRSITRHSKLNLNVKIGGCEAKNDVFFCKKLNTNSIVAPMVESSYALKKFIQISNYGKKIPLLINIETINSIDNLNSIINSKEFSKLSGIVLGRSDLAGSLGMTKKQVNSKKIFNILKKVFKKIKNKQSKKFIIKMGGSITKDSKNFISNLYKKKLLDRIETRNIEIRLNNKTLNNLDTIIFKAFKFEIDWLRYKIKINSNKNRDNFKLSQDKLRIDEMKKRFSKKF